MTARPAVASSCAKLAALALTIGFSYGAYVYRELAAVRPFLYFVLIDGEPPPVCGFCVLFGS